MIIHSGKIAFTADRNEEIFAIGDMHGLIENLKEALEIIKTTPRIPGRRRVVVYTGDLIDRGPKPLACIDAAMDTAEITGADEVKWLMGNHEQMLATAIGPVGGPEFVLETLGEKQNTAGEIWYSNGGAALIAQHGHWNLPKILGARRHAWITSLDKFYVSGSVLFIHAGVPLYRTLADIEADCDDIDLSDGGFRENNHWAWVREPFLKFEAGADGHDGFFVVHGHTPINSDPVRDSLNQIARARLNIDGGSFRTGKIRMVQVIDDQVTLHEI